MNKLEDINDEKPRVVLNEYKITKVIFKVGIWILDLLLFIMNFQNLPSGPTVFDEPFSIRGFKKKFKIVIIRNENYELEFDMIGIHPAIANTFRRLMLSDVPSMAIEKVYIQNNTSIIQDEVLAHRLGLIPLKADPRLFENRESKMLFNFYNFQIIKIWFSEPDEATEHDTLEFELKIKCSFNKEANKKDSSRVEDMYKNNSGEWMPFFLLLHWCSATKILLHNDILLGVILKVFI